MTTVVIVLVSAVLAVVVWLALYRRPSDDEAHLRRTAEERLADLKARNVRRIERDKEEP